MNVPQEELDRWARFANEVRGRMLRLPRLISWKGNAEVEREMNDLMLLAAQMTKAMEAAGATPPVSVLPVEPVPLELLASEANRRYYQKLYEAWEAAIAVDIERGCHPHGPADLLADRIARVEREVYGPAGLNEGFGR